MKYSTLIIIAIVLVIAAFTNPTIHHHREEVKKIVMAKVTSQMSLESSDGYELVGQSMGLALGSNYIDQLISKAIYIDDYGFFSITRGKTGIENNVIGYGLFGQVFIFEGGPGLL